MAREQVAQRIVTGTLSGAANTIAKPVYVPKPCTISEVRIYADHAPSGGTAHFRVMLNGVQIGTLDILSGALSGSTSGLAQAGVRGDILTIDLISTPSSIGDNLNIEFVMGESGATATDAQLRDRATHGGVQAAATISDFMETVYSNVKGMLLASGAISYGFDDTNYKVTISDAGGAGALGITGYRTTDQGLTTNGLTLLSFEDEAQATGQWNISDPTKIIVPFTGWYAVVGHVKVTSNEGVEGTTRTLEVLRNGAMVANEITDPTLSGVFAVTVISFLYLTLNDYLQLRYTMDTAATETAKAGVRNCFLTVLPVGIGAAGGGTMEVAEADAAPDVTLVSKLIVGNGDVTDNMDGSVRLRTLGDLTTSLIDGLYGYTPVSQAYVDGIVAAQDAMVFKGVINCSANPNYPAADRGHTYRVSVAGKIGGASGVNVEVGDILMCLTDGTASGNQATVGAQWAIIQANLDGAIISGSAAGGDLSGTYPNPSIVDDSHAHTGATLSGVVKSGDSAGGDLTGTYPNPTVANDAVSYAKMQNVSAASKLLGRGDSGAGDPQEITLGTGLSMSGTTLNASGGGGGIADLTGDVVASGTGSVAALVKAASSDFAISGIISPASLSANQNDYNPTGLSAANVIRQDSSANITLTGLAGGATGRVFIYFNISNYYHTFANNSGSSSAGKRFLCLNGMDATLPPGASCLLWWDTTSNAYRVSLSVRKLVNSDVTWPPAPSAPNADDDEFDSGSFAAWTDVGIDTTHAKKAMSGSLAQIECVVANSDFRGIYKAISGSTFRVQAGPFRYTGPQAGSPEYDIGIYLRETSTNKGLLVGPRCNSSTGGFTGTQLYSTRFTGQSWQNAASLFAPWNQWDWIWFEAELTGSNVIVRQSNDGVFFRQILSESKTASFTAAPNAIGFGFYAESQAFFFTVDYVRRLA